MVDVLALIGAPRRLARIGTVTDVATGGVATVDVDGGPVFAQLTDQTSTVSVGALVAVLPVGDGDTWLVVASLTGGGPGGPVLGSNLLANPSMEFGAPGGPPTSWDAFWTSGLAATTWDGTPGAPHTGSGVAQVTLTPTADIPNTNLFSTVVALDPGVTYRCSAWLRASGATSSNQMNVTMFSAPLAADAAPFGVGALSVTLATVALPGAAWQEAYGSFTLATGHRFVRLCLHTTADAGADLTAWWDDAGIRQVITT